MMHLYFVKEESALPALLSPNSPCLKRQNRQNPFLDASQTSGCRPPKAPEPPGPRGF